MNKGLFCTRCGNTLFFKKVINGTFSIPIEVEEWFEDETREVYNKSEIEIINVFDEHYECCECGSDYVEPEEQNDNEYI